MPPTLSTETGYSGTVSLLPLPMSLNSTRAVSRASTWQTRVFANNEPEPKTVPPTPPPPVRDGSGGYFSITRAIGIRRRGCVLYIVHIFETICKHVYRP